MKTLFLPIFTILSISLVTFQSISASSILAGQSISGKTWHDINGDGLYQIDEPLLEEIIVTIIDVATGQEPLDITTNNPVGNRLTNEIGAYSFMNIPAGNYILTFITQEPGLYATKMDVIGSSMEFDNDSDIDIYTNKTSIISLSVDDEITTIDAGFFLTVEINGFVWHDSDADGMFEIEDEQVLPSDIIITVIDIATGNPAIDVIGNPAVIEIPSGNAVENYTFANKLAPGHYSIQISLPNKWNVTDLGFENIFDPTTLLANIAPTELTSGSTVTGVNAGVYRLLSLSGILFGDKNHNCTYNLLNDTVYADVYLTLKSESEGIFINQTGTDATGVYLFENIKPGDYSIEINYQNFVPSGPLQNLSACSNYSEPNNDIRYDNNGKLDQNISVVSGTIELRSGAEAADDGFLNNTIDFGMVQEYVPFSPFAYLTCKGAALNPVCDVNVLNGLQAIQPDFPNIEGPRPLCPGTSSEPSNMLWYSFIAGNGDYDIEFEVSNCIQIDLNIEPGIQIGLYYYDPDASSCWNDYVGYCKDTCVTGNKIVDGSYLIPGVQYLLFLDGCGGSYCNYKINILGEFIPYVPAEPTQLLVNGIEEQVTSIVVGTELTFEVKDATDSYNDNPSQSYKWSLRNENGAIITDWQIDPQNWITSSPAISYLFEELGSYEVCIDEIVDVCGNTVQGGICQKVVVADSSTNIIVGGKVWSDLDYNCFYQQSTDELFIGVSVSIYNESNISIGTTLTDTIGEYSFSVPEGKYTIQLDKENFLSGGKLMSLLPCSSMAANPNNDLPNDNNGKWYQDNSIRTDTIILTAGQEPGGNSNLTIDFGFDLNCGSENNPAAYLDCEDASKYPYCNIYEYENSCGTTPDFFYNNGPSPFCNGASFDPNAVSWFSFIAGISDYSIEIEIVGCSPNQQGDVGLVAALFNSDSGPNCWGTSVYCDDAPSTSKITIPVSSITIPGHKYLLGIDGYKGSFCGYEINILGTFIPFKIAPPTSLVCNQISNCDTIALGQSLSLKAQRNMEDYDSLVLNSAEWSVKNMQGDIIDDSSVNPDLISSGSTISYVFKETGTFQICLDHIEDVCSYAPTSDLCYEVTVVKPDYILSGYTYIDDNNNGIFDLGELPLPNFKIIDPSINMTYFTNNDGFYSIPTWNGMHTFRVQSTYGSWVDVAYDFDVNIMEENTLVDLPFIPIDEEIKAEGFISSGMLRCNSFVLFNISALNTSSELLSGSMEITFDPSTIYYEFDPQPTKLSNTMYVFNFSDINPGLSFSPHIRLGIPAFFPMLDSMTFSVVIKDNEGNVLDEKEYTDVIRCSYDPNDKRSWPDRPGDENHILAGEFIDYTIRFQNNGNDTAFYVKVIDVISPYLDPSTIKLQESSHDMTVQIHMDSLFFIFDPIALVDSTTNYEESQGFVSFSIMTKETVAVGDIIHNKAEIIFDKNEAIITNSTTNTVIDILPCYQISNTINQSGNMLFADDQGLLFQWLNCADSLVVYESSEPTFIPATNGQYQLVIEGENCKNVSDCYNYIITNTDDKVWNELLVYPNPTTGRLIIQDDFQYLEATFIGLLGQVTQVPVLNNTVDISPLPKGIYLLKLQNGTTTFKTKIVKI